METVKKDSTKEEVEENVEVDEDAPPPSFDAIERLQEQGINAGDIKKLKEAGMNTIQAVRMHTKKVFFHQQFIKRLFSNVALGFMCYKGYI